MIYLGKPKRERESFRRKEKKRDEVLVVEVCCVKVALNVFTVCYYAAVLKMLGCQSKETLEEVILTGFTVR